jgi:hypothetical protein
MEFFFNDLFNKIAHLSFDRMEAVDFSLAGVDKA